LHGGNQLRLAAKSRAGGRLKLNAGRHWLIILDVDSHYPLKNDTGQR
jgi:hypothetical protein